MKNIKEYIFEKSYINRNNINESLLNMSEFCLVKSSKQDLIDDYADCLVTSKNKKNALFVMKKDAAKEVKDKKKIVYEIPSQYKSLDDLEEDFYNDKLDIENLKQIKF